MKLKIDTKLVLLLLGGLAVRVLLANFGTLALDQNTFIAWSSNLVSGGFKTFYNGWSDYLPGYLYVLWLLGKVNIANGIPAAMLYKLPAILADVVTSFLVYRIVREIKDKKWALISAGLYLFNPAILSNSAMWGQVDSLTALFSVLAVYLAAKKSLVGSSVSLAIGTLVKPQAAFAAPVVLALMIRDKWQVRKILLYGFIGMIIFLIGFVPFYGSSNFVPVDFLGFVVQRISSTVNQYPYTSVNAFNFWGLTGFWKSDFTLGFTYLVPFLTVIIAYLRTKKEKNFSYLLLSLSMTTSFMFLTRMHERHLLPALAPILVAAAINPLALVAYLGFSLTYILNMNYSYNWITNNFISIYSDSLIKLFIILNLVFVTTLFVTLFRKVEFKSMVRWLKDLWQSKSEKRLPFPKLKVKTKHAEYILAAILVFVFVSRTLFLWNPPNEYFDEVYHAFTARVMLHGDPKAWEWWNTPPEGFAYEWTHPPFAKEAMVAGMTIFGENSFGWRIPAAIFGTGSVFMVYLIAKKLFDDEILALISAGVLSLDGLTLVLSRIGMNDSYFVFFALLSIYLFLREKDFGSALALGFAAASKWTVFWAVPVLGVIFLSLRRKIKPSLAWFFVLPPVIYFASYLPMFQFPNHNINTFIEVQKQMWWYHTNLKATHAYSSMWWSWPFLIRPVWLYTSGVVNGLVGNIYAMGNPIVFWFGLTAVVISAYWAYAAKDRRVGIVIFAYLAFFTTWAISPRIMFMYHYLPSIPFLAIASGYVLRRYTKLIPVYFAIALIVFIYFYPHFTGIKVPVWLDHSYYWFDTWR